MRIAVLSDIHANLNALDAVLRAVGEVDAFWHLGDVVGYGPEPNRVVDRLREIGAVGVRGNHDVAALGGNEIDDFNQDARAAMIWTRERLEPRALEWLSALPEKLVNGEFTLAHGSPRDPVWEYLMTRRAAKESFSAFETPYCFVGHTHVPVVFMELDGEVEMLAAEPGTELALGEERAIVNPGSVGQPRDGEPEASCVVLEIGATTTITWHRVPYDVEATQAAMASEGLPPRLVSRLTWGY